MLESSSLPGISSCEFLCSLIGLLVVATFTGSLAIFPKFLDGFVWVCVGFHVGFLLHAILGLLFVVFNSQGYLLLCPLPRVQWGVLEGLFPPLPGLAQWVCIGLD